MSCTSLNNMCTTCTNLYNCLQTLYPNTTIDFSPGTYPIVFRAVFTESSAPFDHGLKVADRIEALLSRTLGKDIPVLAYSNFAAKPRAESEVWATILIEFPLDDLDAVEKGFRAGCNSLGGWEVLLPEGCCLTAFWLAWHLGPMVMDEKGY